ncbi:MAG: hypothetical protein HY461_01020 [Parcubacteria group bacterium]|nr:hypothetical protein [Parcubacteria group bacterium]
MKHYSFLAGLSAVAIAALGLVAGVQAQSTATVTLHAADDTLVYPRDFDVLALDFTVNSTASDALKTLTIAAQGTARPTLEYSKLRLWSDRGTAGFQGWGYDQPLAEGNLVSGLWVFTGFTDPFAQAFQRYFVSLESGTNTQADKVGQFQLLPGGEDGDGVYEGGEQGIFLTSGVIAALPPTTSSHTLRFKSSALDKLAPKAILKDVSIVASAPTVKVAPVAPIIFAGEARDRNGGTVQTVKLVINGQDWVATSINGTGYAQWSASYTPAAATEDLVITIHAADGTGLTWTSEPYYLSIRPQAPAPMPDPQPSPEPAPDPIPEPEPAPQPVLSDLEAGDLIKGSLSAVYHYGADGKRHVFVHQNIYASWYGTDFSKVKTISDEQLASISLGVPVPFMPGRLIKVPSVPAVYVVDAHQTLRHITTEALAQDYFGPDWNKQISDLSEALLVTYNFGEPIVIKSDFSLEGLNAQTVTIDSELAD